MRLNCPCSPSFHRLNFIHSFLGMFVIHLKAVFFFGKWAMSGPHRNRVCWFCLQRTHSLIGWFFIVFHCRILDQFYFTYSLLRLLFQRFLGANRYGAFWASNAHRWLTASRQVLQYHSLGISTGSFGQNVLFYLF